MEARLKKKFPEGALSFYIELYCKRKSETECIGIAKAQQQALKSWISLNKSEKNYFETKYNEHRSNFKKSIALNLKNAEPYMKSKVPNRNRAHNLNLDTIEINKGNSQTEISSTEKEVDNNEDNSSYNPIYENTELNELMLLPEPIPPKVMSSKELFLIIKEREQNDLSWKKLQKPQKKRYADAVLAIKKNYLKQYREYLEHLPSEKLFYHYRNVIT